MVTPVSLEFTVIWVAVRGLSVTLDTGGGECSGVAVLWGCLTEAAILSSDGPLREGKLPRLRRLGWEGLPHPVHHRLTSRN